MIDDREFDRKLIARFAQSGRITSAERIYAMVAGTRALSKSTEAWKPNSPPFDWQPSAMLGPPKLVPRQP